MKYLILILFCFNVSVESVEYRWTSSLSSEYTDAFTRSAKVWELALDNKIKFVRDDSNPTILFRKKSLPNGIVGQALGTVPYAEVRITADVQINFVRNPDVFQLFIDDILVHEIGHILGLKHSLDLQETPDLETMQPSQVYSQGMLSSLHVKDVNRVRKLFGLSEIQTTILTIEARKTRKTISLFVSDCDENVVWHVQDNRQTYILIGNPVEIPRSRHKIKAYWNGNSGEMLVRPAQIRNSARNWKRIPVVKLDIT